MILRQRSETEIRAEANGWVFLVERDTIPATEEEFARGLVTELSEAE